MSGLCLTATKAGMWSDFRNRAQPILDNRDRLILLPDGSMDRFKPV
nr:hypothetical protein [uncultured Cycloclasticus sp.]